VYKKSLFASALQKIENKFNKNTTPYFYLFVIIVPKKVENELDKNTNIWYIDILDMLLIIPSGMWWRISWVVLLTIPVG